MSRRTSLLGGQLEPIRRQVSVFNMLPTDPIEQNTLGDTQGKVLSLTGLAAQVSGSIPGVRQAIHVIEREGGVISRETVREKTAEGAILQGFRIALNRTL